MWYVARFLYDGAATSTNCQSLSLNQIRSAAIFMHGRTAVYGKDVPILHLFL